MMSIVPCDRLFESEGSLSIGTIWVQKPGRSTIVAIRIKVTRASRVGKISSNRPTTRANLKIHQLHRPSAA